MFSYQMSEEEVMYLASDTELKKQHAELKSLARKNERTDGEEDIVKFLLPTKEELKEKEVVFLENLNEYQDFDMKDVAAGLYAWTRDTLRASNTLKYILEDSVNENIIVKDAQNLSKADLVNLYVNTIFEHKCEIVNKKLARPTETTRRSKRKQDEASDGSSSSSNSSEVNEESRRAVGKTPKRMTLQERENAIAEEGVRLEKKRKELARLEERLVKLQKTLQPDQDKDQGEQEQGVLSWAAREVILQNIVENLVTQEVVCPFERLETDIKEKLEKTAWRKEEFIDQREKLVKFRIILHDHPDDAAAMMAYDECKRRILQHVFYGRTGEAELAKRIGKGLQPVLKEAIPEVKEQYEIWKTIQKFSGKKKQDGRNSGNNRNRRGNGNGRGNRGRNGYSVNSGNGGSTRPYVYCDWCKRKQNSHESDTCLKNPAHPDHNPNHVGNRR